jgi:hypothetical protein
LHLIGDLAALKDFLVTCHLLLMLYGRGDERNLKHRAHAWELSMPHRMFPFAL